MIARVLFVCLGNVCRSPAAEAVLRSLALRRGLADQFEIDSAGTGGHFAGRPADPRMRKAAAARGYCIDDHRARQATIDDLRSFDLIVAMDDANYDELLKLGSGGEFRGKICRLVDFCTTEDAAETPDPYYGGSDGFELALRIIEDGCRGIIDQLA